MVPLAATAACGVKLTTNRVHVLGPMVTGNFGWLISKSALLEVAPVTVMLELVGLKM